MEKPVVAIYMQEGWPMYRVEIGGKEVESLRSFKIEISNEIDNRDNSAPFYQIEQYLLDPS